MEEFNERKTDAPVSEGDVFLTHCEGTGSKGAGIFRKKGFVIFVENAKEGKNYEIKIYKVLTKVAFGTIVQDVPS